MQKTRKAILDYLKENGAATVDELAAVLNLTTVTVRHHLDILRSDEVVSEPAVRHRSTPGRPQYAYTLTGKASEHFPKNYCDLAGCLLEEVKASGTPQAVNVFFEGVANRMAALAPAPCPARTWPSASTRRWRFSIARAMWPTGSAWTRAICCTPAIVPMRAWRATTRNCAAWTSPWQATCWARCRAG